MSLNPKRKIANNYMEGSGSRNKLEIGMKHTEQKGQPSEQLFLKWWSLSNLDRTNNYGFGRVIPNDDT